MKSVLQSFLLRLYQAVQASGVLKTSWGSSTFEWAYHHYKGFLEAGDIRVLATFIKPRTIVIDVGANIGFFTRFFGRSVLEGGVVIAIEPEAANFSRLNRMVARQRLGEVVQTIQAVAAVKSGTLKLKINPLHPADHKISDDGIAVKAVALDELVAERQWREVSLIKIDVQGAEEMVLRGAPEIIRRFHPTLYLEIDDEGLRRMKSTAETIFNLLQGQGYSIHQINKGSISPSMNLQESIALCSGGKYADFLFLHTPKS